MKQAGATSEGRILIVDDDELAVEALERVLRMSGFRQVRSITDSRQVIPAFRDFDPDIVLLDLHMPGLDGFAIIRQLLVRVPESDFLPILVISGDLAPEAKEQALAMGASDFLEKPFGQREICLRVSNLLHTRALSRGMEERVRARTADLRVSEVELAMRLAAACELRDYHDAAHVQRVGNLSALVAERLGLDSEEVELIRLAAPLHDIGKIAIPDAILLKPESLSLEEWDVMKTHTTIGAQLLSGSRSPILQLAEEIALYHHEAWNGTGYTPGLEGEDIPLVGRIVAAADCFDALTHTRPYKQPWSTTEAIGWMEGMRGLRYDPRVFDCLIDVLATVDLNTLHVPQPWEIMLPVLVEPATAAS
jgi:putative two-component system response regulator